MNYTIIIITPEAAAALVVPPAPGCVLVTFPDGAPVRLVEERNPIPPWPRPIPPVRQLALDALRSCGTGGWVPVESCRAAFYARQPGKQTDTKKKAFARIRDQLGRFGVTSTPYRSHYLLP